MLAHRKLITFTRHSFEVSVVIVGLTFEGFELGRDYSSWLLRSQHWYREHKDHWIMLGLVWIGAGVVLNELCRLLFRWLS